MGAKIGDITLSEIRAKSKPGECPFCGDPIKEEHSTKKWRYCGEPECLTAYHRMYQRERRKKGKTHEQREEQVR